MTWSSRRASETRIRWGAAPIRPAAGSAEGTSRPLVPRMEKPPKSPGEAEWLQVLEVFRGAPSVTE